MSYISVIVPTLNEESYIGDLLDSLERQGYKDYDVVVVDGGSKDKTLEICKRHSVRTASEVGLREFPSRNEGAGLCEGEILLFTGADVLFPERVLGKLAEKFTSDDKLLAVAGPGIPSDAPFLFVLEFSLYNFLRYLLAKLPKPLKRFSTSSNLLAVRRDTFEEIGGFEQDNVNADGIFGKTVSRRGKVIFSLLEIRVFMSARRLREMGFIKFNVHFAYVIENFLPFLSGMGFLKKRKLLSGSSHSKMRQFATFKP